MRNLVLIFVTGICLFLSTAAYCQSIAALPIKGEDDLMRVIESRHKERMEQEYREYLSGSKVHIEIAAMEIETRAAPSKDDIGSYDINIYYVDPTDKGCGDRLLQIALYGATLAHRFKDAEIGTITAIPVFPDSRQTFKKKMRGIVVINYLLDSKELFSRIADGKLRDEDITEMNMWLRAWKEVRLDPDYEARIGFK